jgi:soluble lytic murein transglycosylase-like protein
VRLLTAFAVAGLFLASSNLVAGERATSAAPSPVAVLAQNAFPLPVPTYLAAIISDAAHQYRVDPNLIAAMAFRESRFNPTAVSSRGAQGVMQLMPKTARSLGVSDSFDARQNVFAGTKYLSSLLQRFGGDVDRSLAAYNAGPELVARVGPGATREAIDYVAAVKQFYSNALRFL